MGRVIYGDAPEIMSRLEYIKARDNVSIEEARGWVDFDVTRWVEMKNKARQGYKFGPLKVGVRRLATILGIVVPGSNPSKKQWLEMGRVIYGDVPEIVEAIGDLE